MNILMTYVIIYLYYTINSVTVIFILSLSFMVIYLELSHLESGY